MNITELQLIQFGKFSDCTIKIEDGFNLIYGENEAGKSTVLLFIKTMLYGIPTKRGKSGEVKDRMRVIPWDKDRAIGRIKFSDGGRNIEVYREFRKRVSGDLLRVTDSDTGEDIGGIDGEVGEYFFGMSEGMFGRTLWIAQDDVCMRGKDDEITARLMNLLSTGTASDVSVSDVMNRLDKKELSLKARTKRNTKGEIDLLMEERDNLSAELYNIGREAAQREQKKNELEIISRRISKISAETEKLGKARQAELAEEKIKRVAQLDSCLKREMQLANTQMYQVFKHRDDEAALSELKTARSVIERMEVGAYNLSENRSGGNVILEKLINSRSRNKILWLISALVFAVISGVGFVFSYMIAGLAFAAAAVVCAVICVAQYRKMSAEIKKESEHLKAIDEQLEELRSKISEKEEEIKNILSDFECEDFAEFSEKYSIYSEAKAKIKVCRDLYSDILGGDDYGELKAEADELSRSIIDIGDYKNIDIEDRLKQLSAEHSREIERAAELKQSLASAEPLRAEVDIRAEIAETDKQLASKYAELKAVQLAAECIGAAYSKIKSDFTPQLNSETQRLLEKMTGGRHSNIKVADDFSLRLNESGDSGELRQAELFSMGAYNQIYFALRLAIAYLTVPADKRVFCIDDLLMTFDDLRSRQTIDMLADMCAEDKIQIIMFTCHGRDYEYIKQKNLNEITVS